MTTNKPLVLGSTLDQLVIASGMVVRVLPLAPALGAPVYLTWNLASVSSMSASHLQVQCIKVTLRQFLVTLI